MGDITKVSDDQLPPFHLFVVVVGWGVQCVFCDAETAPELFDSDRERSVKLSLYCRLVLRMETRIATRSLPTAWGNFRRNVNLTF
jgi:hypothetical protein